MADPVELCGVEDCTRVLRARGMCSTHYMREYSAKEPLYQKWLSMRKRCNSPTNKSYKDYGGRGIKICERWDDFKNYKEDILNLGAPPSSAHTINRINNDGDYAPNNIEWAPRTTQSRNRRMQKTNKSGASDVIYNKRQKRWVARIAVNNDRVFLGAYKTREDAIHARYKAVKEYWNE